MFLIGCQRGRHSDLEIWAGKVLQDSKERCKVRMEAIFGALLRRCKLLILLTIFVLTSSVTTALAQTSDIVLYAAEATTRSGNWRVEADSSGAGGNRMRYPDAGGPKLETAFANPTHYFEMNFNAQAGTPYRLWMRGKADSNSTDNDSAWVQFSGSVNSGGTPVYRISTTSATMFNLEDCTGCGLSQWGWNDNQFGGMGPVIYFAASGAQRVRVQLREDGLAIDQIVLSPVNYLNTSPGSGTNDSLILSRNAGTVTNSNVVLWAADVPSTAIHGNWQRIADSSAAGQVALHYADFGGPRLTTPFATPTHYFEMTFNAQAGTPYRLWMRGKAIGNSTNNDSVWVQFSSSLNSSGSAAFRIGSTSAIMYNMEECTGCGLSNWGWNDSDINGLGPLVYFSSTGQQKIRVQLREDGISVDQIVLSPQTYLSSSPGVFKNDSEILSREGGTEAPAPAPNQPPQVSIGATPTSGTSPLNSGFTSSASDPDGAIVSYNWTFGDGHTSTAVAPSHVYQTAGSYTARLTVTDNAGAASSASLAINVSAPTTTGTRFKVLQWNVAYGRGTDNIIDHNRQATWMAKMNVDLISLNEVPPTDTQKFVDLLRQKTGVTWYSHWVAIKPGDSVGQQILSRRPFVSTGARYLSFGRSVAQVTVSIGGRTIHLFSTHLSPDAQSWRVTQMNEMHAWMSGFSEQKIIAADYNLSPNWPDYLTMTSGFYDSWAQAAASGVAFAYPDNPEGRTRKGRIDYINYSKSASGIRLIETRMPDQRDLNNRNVVIGVGNSNDWGVRPSDHNFFVTTFEIR